MTEWCCIQHVNPVSHDILVHSLVRESKALRIDRTVTLQFASSRVNPCRQLVPTSTPASLTRRQISTGMLCQCCILRDARAAGESCAPPISTRPSLLTDGTDHPKSHSCCIPQDCSQRAVDREDEFSAI
ncbi:hypothetical protein BLNAU_9831 [Blattamonas nauphoetae]|uniref:Uncharacterized protein n=1 Tax=Blattamonas nauphoetae TaxID=2049346 RepID=A0ABQ9XUX9_9EUKA|nr:hypothetical protein BLNAU_9831 [Blattamonas nauphoetae]